MSQECMSEIEKLHCIRFILSAKRTIITVTLNPLLVHIKVQHTGQLIDTSTICRAVKGLGMTRQRIHHRALQQSEVKCAEFAAEM